MRQESSDVAVWVPLLKAALKDTRVTDANFREIARAIVWMYAEAEPTPEQAHRVAVTIDILIEATDSPSARTASAPPEPLIDSAAVAAGIVRAAAIARGETVVDLPTDPVARGVILAGMKRRNEPPPGGRL